VASLSNPFHYVLSYIYPNFAIPLISPTFPIPIGEPGAFASNCFE
jgi:hypothetical protein